MTLQQVQNFMLALVYLGYTPQQAAANPYVCLASDWLRDTDGAPAGWFTPGTGGVRVTTPTGEVIEVSDQEIKNVTEPDLPRWSGGPWINGAIRADMESESFSWLTLKVFDSRLTPQAPPTSKEFSW